MLYNTGTLIVQSGTAGKSVTDTFGAMKASAAAVIGGENQAFYLDLAGKGILKGIDVVNMKHAYRFGTFQASDTTLIVATDEYAIPTGTFAIHEVQLIDAAGKVERTLEYVPWGQFNTLLDGQDMTGNPEFWTSRNMYDEGKIQLYPIPDDATLDLRISYYQRVARVTLDSDIIDAPRELSEVLVTYAEYYLLRLRDKKNPTVWLERKRAFDEQLADYVVETEREPTENLQWVLAPRYRGSIYDPLA